MPKPVLVVLDVQERLFDAMDGERRDDMIRNIKIVGTAARRLGVPVIVTEPYPRGLGRTLPEVRALLDGGRRSRRPPSPAAAPVGSPTGSASSSPTASSSRESRRTCACCSPRSISWR